MKQTSQLDAHVDAESLSAFVERALPEPERLQVLSHIAICGQCREVLFLAQLAAEEDVLPTAVPAVLPERRAFWFTNWRFAWATAAACAVVAGLALSFGGWHRDTRDETARTDSSDREHTGEIGKVAPPVPAKAGPASSAKAPALTANVPQPTAAPIAVNALESGNSGDEAERLRSISLLPQASTSSQLPSGQVINGGLDPMQAGATPAISAQSSQGRSNQVQSNQVQSSPALRQSAPQSAQTANGNAPAKANSTSTTVDVQAAAQPLLDQQQEVTTTVSATSLNLMPLEARNTATAGKVPGTRSALAKSNASAKKAAASPRGVAAASAGAAPAPSVFSSFIKGKQPLALDDATARRVLYTRLPDGLTAISTAANRPHLLAVDSAGGLFRSEDLGKSWEPVAHVWSGRALEVRVIRPENGPSAATAFDAKDAQTNRAPPCPNCSAAATAVQKPVLFELVTDSVSVWTSEDGKTWNKK